MAPINQPANQIKLTNVSLVRYKKGKKRFELACYKNKLLEYRSGNETDLDNVLQVPTIFLNASKGETAPNAELVKVWPQAEHEPASQAGVKTKGGRKARAKSHGEADSEKTWKDAIIAEILKKGEIQVNANERKELLDRMEREVIEEVAQRLVDPETKRVYTTGMIKKGLDVLSKQGGHAPPADALPQKLGKLDLEDGETKGGSPPPKDSSETNADSPPPKGSSETDAVGTSTTEEDDQVNSNGQKGKDKKSDMPMWTGVVATKSVKQQALDAMHALIAWQPIPVMRARMRLRVTCPISLSKQAARSKASSTEHDGNEGKGTIESRILSYIEQIESQDVLGEVWEVIGFVEPGAFKDLGEFCSAETKGRGKVEILDMAVVHTDE